MKASRLLTIAAAIIPFPALSTVAPSHCAVGEEVIFNCNTGKKTVSVCGTNKTAMQYRFGVIGNPEIAIPNDGNIKVFSYTFLKAYHTEMTFMTVKNGDYEYDVSSGMNVDGEESSGVDVSKNSKSLAMIKCKMTSDIHYLDSDRLEAYGIRYEYDISK